MEKILKTENFLRQLDILDPSMIIYPITIIGAGGIGSITAWILAKMGCKDITIYDSDKVEEHNLPNQFFQLKDIERFKVEAVRDNVLQFTHCEIKAVPEVFQNQAVEGIVISGVDSMESRRNIWKNLRSNFLKVPLYIDGRLGGEITQVYTIKPYQIEDIEIYEKTLHSDKEVVDLPCTAQNIIYNGTSVGSLIAAQTKKWLRKEKYYREITFDLVNMRVYANSLVVKP